MEVTRPNGGRARSNSVFRPETCRKKSPPTTSVGGSTAPARLQLLGRDEEGHQRDSRAGRRARSPAAPPGRRRRTTVAGLAARMAVRIWPLASTATAGGSLGCSAETSARYESTTRLPTGHSWQTAAGQGRPPSRPAACGRPARRAPAARRCSRSKPSTWPCTPGRRRRGRRWAAGGSCTGRR
jgi:hypothetical protein